MFLETADDPNQQRLMNEGQTMNTDCPELITGHVKVAPYNIFISDQTLL